jgi:hypothetical protein
LPCREKVLTFPISLTLNPLAPCSSFLPPNPLNQVPLLSSLRRHQLEALFQGMENSSGEHEQDLRDSSDRLLRTFAPGEVVATAGDACDTLYVVHRFDFHCSHCFVFTQVSFLLLTPCPFNKYDSALVVVFVV